MRISALLSFITIYLLIFRPAINAEWILFVIFTIMAFILEEGWFFFVRYKIARKEMK